MEKIAANGRIIFGQKYCILTHFWHNKNFATSMGGGVLTP